MFSFFYPHISARNFKQQQRQDRIASLPSVYREDLSEEDIDILKTPISKLVLNVQNGEWIPLSIIRAYGKQALVAHRETNCLTEIMIHDAERWIKDPSLPKSGSLAGLPVSFKDTINVKGYDSCIGFSAWVNRPAEQDGALVRLLRDAGAVPYVKTSVPTTLLSFECSSSVFGCTTNPYKATHIPGGSSGGEAALLAFGGSRIGIGTDVGGSVRVPAHFCGIYSVRASTGRFPRSGNTTSVIGQEGVPAVYSPMAASLEELEWFWEKVIDMEPWKYDHSCHPIPWRKISLPKVVRFGVLWDDGIVPPTPACKRALEETVRALKALGHEVFTFSAPSPYEGHKIGSQLLSADGGYFATSHLLPREPNDPGVIHCLKWFKTPSFIRSLYLFYVRYIRRDALYADLLSCWTQKSIREVWKLTGQREAYRMKWHNAWKEQGMDFLLCTPYPTPSIRHGGMRSGFLASNWTFMFNVLDYTAGVLPITRVQPKLDSLPQNELSSIVKQQNAIARGIWSQYDAQDMEGLPVGVQVVGQRWEEERVMKAMMEVERCVKASGGGFRGLNQFLAPKIPNYQPNTRQTPEQYTVVV